MTAMRKDVRVDEKRPVNLADPIAKRGIGVTKNWGILINAKRPLVGSGRRGKNSIRPRGAGWFRPCLLVVR